MLRIVSYSINECWALSWSIIPVSWQLARKWHNHKPGGRLSLLYAKSTVIFAAEEHHCRLAVTKIYRVGQKVSPYWYIIKSLKKSTVILHVHQLRNYSILYQVYKFALLLVLNILWFSVADTRMRRSSQSIHQRVSNSRKSGNWR